MYGKLSTTNEKKLILNSAINDTLYNSVFCSKITTAVHAISLIVLFVFWAAVMLHFLVDFHS